MRLEKEDAGTHTTLTFKDIARKDSVFLSDSLLGCLHKRHATHFHGEKTKSEGYECPFARGTLAGTGGIC